MPLPQFTEHQLSDMVISTTRYYCGRCTGMVSTWCDWLIEWWPQLPEHVRTAIRNSVEDAFRRDDFARDTINLGRSFGSYPLGHDCDRASWEKVRQLWRDS